MADGAYVYGIVVGFEADPTNLTYQYRPASTERVAYVVVATPDLVCQIRDDGGAALTKADIGANAIGIFTHGGSTVTGLSGLELDAGTGTGPAENASNPLTIIGVADIEDNEFDGSTSTHIVWEVLINMCQVGMSTWEVLINMCQVGMSTGLTDAGGAKGEQGA